MHRLVQADLHRAYGIGHTHFQQQTIGRIGSRKIREYQSIHLASCKSREGILRIEKVTFQFVLNLHLAIDGHIREIIMKTLYYPAYHLSFRFMT